MKRHHEQGIALITTLIMLSLVTFTAVAFLTLTRRERATVRSTEYQVIAKQMEEAARSRAMTELTANMVNRENRFGYQLLVSLNYQRPGGFITGNTSISNVNYRYNGGGILDQADQVQNIANLFYDPRVPVYVDNDGDGKVRYDFSTGGLVGPDDFRFYLDFNRNRRFEPTFFGLGDDNAGLSHADPTNWFGDPHWIGVLDRPDARHSPSNRFVGRYSFLVLPAGKSLDLNYLHNQAKLWSAPPASPNYDTDEGFLRNQGMGSWEINLASFLVELNRDAWQTNINGGPVVNPYVYRTSVNFSSSGTAFEDAFDLLRFTFQTNRTSKGIYPNLNSAFGEFGNLATNFQIDGLDTYSQGPIRVGTSLQHGEDDDVSDPWVGASKPNRFYDIQALFDDQQVFSNFSTRVTGRMRNFTGHHDRYTLYRMLAQLGSDSTPPLPNKIHLNYNNLNGFSQTNFVPWEAQDLFNIVADTLLRKRFGFSILDPGLGIPLYDGNSNSNLAYNPNLHQTLQLAANIFDATTGAEYPEWATNTPYSMNQRVLWNGLAYESLIAGNLGMRPPDTPLAWQMIPHMPSVFRPRFTNISDVVYISDYVHETNTTFLTNTWRDVTDPADRAALTADNNVFGVPVIVGAKKGLPNFNEFAMQTSVQVTRKLEVRKSVPVNATNFVQTNQMLLMTVSNKFAVEFWNSYTQAYPNPVSVFVNHHQTGAITNSSGTILRAWTNVIPRTTLVPNWPGGAFVSAIWTNANQTPYGRHVPMEEEQYTLTTSPASFTSKGDFDRPSGFPNPDWRMNITNRLTGWIVDQNTGRLLDVINFSDFNTGMDIQQSLLDADAGHWNTDRANGSSSILAPTEGVLRQIRASLNPNAAGSEGVSVQDWDNYPNFQTRNWAVDKFRRFMGLSPLYSGGSQNNQTPPWTNVTAAFMPTFTFHQVISWQANDPLVHYMRQDLIDPVRMSNGDYSFRRVRPSWRALPGYHENPRFRRVRDPEVGVAGVPVRNERYLPWGGNRTPGRASETNSFPRVSDYYLALKDPGVRWSDDWNFPTYPFANVGWLGRIHRGTPWQTVYFKADVAPNGPNNRMWRNWSNNDLTHPTNDWVLPDMFSTLPNPNAGRGLLSVNQTNAAAWFAVLGGINVISNDVDDFNLSVTSSPSFTPITIDPNSPGIIQVIEAIHRDRETRTGNVYTNIGQLLRIPELTIGRTNLNSVPTHSPFINASLGTVGSDPNDPFTNLEKFGLVDAAYEYLPQQLLSLLTVEDHPRFALYSFGQSLQPARRSIVLAPGPTRGLCTNYQITGEIASRAVYRVEGVNPVLSFPADPDVIDLVTDVIRIPRIAFRLEHTARHTGLINGTAVRFHPDPSGGTLPAGIERGLTYYIVDARTDTFRIADRPGGMPVDIVDVGMGDHGMTTVPRIVVENYSLLNND